ncbi:MAG: translation initiation factor IF-6 [Candidatus Woesearchaeota archaeon]
MGHILRTNILGNPNVGLFGFATNTYCLLGKEVPLKIAEQIQETLQVPVYRITLAGTSLIGAFASGNNTILLIPSIVFPQERLALDHLGIKYAVIDTKHTALGNNVLCNDTGCIVNKHLEAKALKEIAQALKIMPKPAELADVEVVGAVAAITQHYGYVHPGIKPFEEEFLASTFKIKITKGTVGLGNPFVHSGLLVNAYGFVAGQTTTGIELTSIDEAFGFLEAKSLKSMV